MQNIFRKKPTLKISVKSCRYLNVETSMFWSEDKIDYNTDRLSSYLSTLDQFVIVRSRDKQSKRFDKMSNFCNNMNPKTFKKNVEAIDTDLFRYVVKVCEK